MSFRDWRRGSHHAITVLGRTVVPDWRSGDLAAALPVYLYDQCVALCQAEGLVGDYLDKSADFFLDDPDLQCAGIERHGVGRAAPA
ncbi:hypothetical protein [Bordetella tumulicola]|uniref:hypothetical protein n=1 Tax=Bordetella tumulicola TaxID=1649133 RepID=UPI0039F12B09